MFVDFLINNKKMTACFLEKMSFYVKVFLNLGGGSKYERKYLHYY